MPKEIEKSISAALSLFALTFMRLAVIFAWYKSRAQTRKRVLCATIYSKRRKRIIWSHNRITPENWWDNIVPGFDDVMWIEHFHMKESTFKEIVEIVKVEMKPGELSFRKPISLSKRVGMALLYLVSGLKLWEIGKLFGVSGVSVHWHFKRFQNVMFSRKDKFLALPSREKAKEMAEKNFITYNIPQVFGVIGGFHLPVFSPEKEHKAYENSLEWTSLVAQAVIDENYRFMDIFVEKPGSSSFDSVFSSSPLFQNSADLLPQDSKEIQNTTVPLSLIGGPGYPLHPWLITPYQDCRTPEQESFNVHAKTMQQRTDIAFLRLMARWHILQKQIPWKSGPNIIVLCCILHNICEMKGSKLVENWADSISYAQPYNPPSQGISADGKEVRDAVCAHMAELLPLKRSNVTVEVDYGDMMDWEDEFRPESENVS